MAKGLSDPKDSSVAVRLPSPKNSSVSWPGHFPFETSSLFSQPSVGSSSSVWNLSQYCRGGGGRLRTCRGWGKPTLTLSKGYLAVATRKNFAAANITPLGRFSRDRVFVRVAMPDARICTCPSSRVLSARSGLSFGDEWSCGRSFLPPSRPTSFGSRDK